MSLKLYFDGTEYYPTYNEQSGFYELYLQAPETGGIYDAEIVLRKVDTKTQKIQVLVKEENTNVSEETLVFFLDKQTLEIKDVIEFENYEYVIDEETNENTILDVSREINASNDDIVILQRNGNVDYIGIVDNIENEDGEQARSITLNYISNIFDRDIILENEDLISSTGIEDFIAQEIYDNFTDSDDTLLNIDWLDVDIQTHTPIQKSVDEENGIYNFHTFVTNCTQNYNIILDFSYSSGRITLSIYKQEQEELLIDTTIEDISNYVEQFETSVTAKVVVKTDTDVQTWYLLSDRTTTQDKDDEERATGKIKTVYTAESEDAEQTAYDCFKGNSYEHYISFKINRNSSLFDVSSLKIGTPLNVRTNNNVVLDTYVSAIRDTGSDFLEITCGNMRINFIEKILKERN